MNWKEKELKQATHTSNNSVGDYFKKQKIFMDATLQNH
jgi:hypothetical protein